MNSFVKYVPIIAALLLLSTTTTVVIAGGAPCDSMFAFKNKPVIVTPESSPIFLCRKMYVLEYSTLRKTAYWSAEHLTRSNLTYNNDKNPRINAFKADPDIYPGSASYPSDYKKSGYDQGHLAPVGDMNKDPEAMLESFYLSNMVPQHPKNNRDGWNQLEAYVRELAIAREELFVISGPIYDCHNNLICKTIGKNKVQVPTHLYKIIYDPKQHVALSFVVPNEPITQLDLPRFITTLQIVESRTKIRFISNNPPAATTPPIKNSTKMWTSFNSD